MEPLNLDAIATEDRGGPAEVGLREASFGSGRLGGAVLEIAPGRRGWPYHWEAAQEEWLLVLDGVPTLRTPEGETTLRAGDLVCFPCGPDGAHQVRNDGDAPCRVLMLSNRVPTNVVFYLDSGKVGIRTPWQGGGFPLAAAVDYWAGE